MISNTLRPLLSLPVLSTSPHFPLLEALARSRLRNLFSFGLLKMAMILLVARTLQNFTDRLLKLLRVTFTLHPM